MGSSTSSYLGRTISLSDDSKKRRESQDELLTHRSSYNYLSLQSFGSQKQSINKNNYINNRYSEVLDKAKSNRRTVLKRPPQPPLFSSRNDQILISSQHSSNLSFSHLSSEYYEKTLSPSSTRSSSYTCINQIYGSKRLPPDMLMGYLYLQEANKVLYVKLFVVLASGQLFLFKKQMEQKPIRPPYGEKLLASICLRNYTLVMCDKSNNFHLIRDNYNQNDKISGTGLPEDLFDIKELVFKTPDSNLSSMSMAEWIDGFNNHIYHFRPNQESSIETLV